VLRARLAGEVHDAVGPHRLDRRRGRHGVVEVGLERGHPGARAPAAAAARQQQPEHLRLGLLRLQVGDQVAADEAARAGDEHPHR